MRAFLGKDFGLTGSTAGFTPETYSLTVDSGLGQRECSYHSALLCYCDYRQQRKLKTPCTQSLEIYQNL